MIIALKGYMGTGKTTISKIICKEYNFKVINADQIVEEMYQTNEQLKQQIVEEFGLKEFDKKELGQIVFKDKEQLIKLESIVHPLLENQMSKMISNTSKDVLIDCQIIDKLNITYDYEILLTASKQTIIDRIKKRDNKDEEIILNILKEQEKFIKQKVKVFPLDSEKEQEEVLNDLNKIMKIFIKEQEYKKYEEEFDEDDW